MINETQYSFLKRIDTERTDLDVLYQEKAIYKDQVFHNAVINLYTDNYFKTPTDFDWIKNSMNTEDNYLKLSQDEVNRVFELEARCHLDRSPFILTQKGIEAIAEYEESQDTRKIAQLSMEYARKANDHAKEANKIAEQANNFSWQSNWLQYGAILIAVLTLFLSILGVI
jgi:hypothetical protein